MDDQIEGEGAHDDAIGDPADSIESSAGSNSTRRDLIKKAAVGSGVVAAVWVAPRVDGLSLRPDYAAAGTASGTFTFVRNGVQGNQAYSVPTPSGNETINASFPSNTEGPVTVNFSSMDPPFNSNCRIVGMNGSAPIGVGNVRTGSVNPTQAAWDIYNPFWGNTNLANCDSITFTINC